MKANLNITLTNTQLKEIFNAMSIPDCKAAISYLERRVKEHEASKIKTKTDNITFNEDILNLHVQDLGFTNRTRCTLIRNQVLTVRDIRDVGLEALAIYKGIGAGAIKEIKRVVYNSY